MSRRKKAHEHVNHERWLVSYADFITLLFAFFVVLYASAQVDNKKIQQVSAAIQGGFSRLGAFPAAAPSCFRPTKRRPECGLSPPTSSILLTAKKWPAATARM